MRDGVLETFFVWWCEIATALVFVVNAEREDLSLAVKGNGVRFS